MSHFHKDFHFTWIIKNFSFIDLKKGAISSPSFDPENNDSLWYIRMGTDVDTEDYVFLDLCECSDDENKEIDLDLEIELCKSNNEVFHTTEKKKVTKLDSLGEYTIPRVMLIEELNKIIEETSTDTLILKCKMNLNGESGAFESQWNRRCIVETTKLLDKLTCIKELEYSDSPHWSEKLSFPIDKRGRLDVNVKSHRDDILFEISLGDRLTLQRIKCEITLLEYRRRSEFSRSYLSNFEKLSSFEFFTFSEKCRIWHFPLFLKKSPGREKNDILSLKFEFTYPADLDDSQYFEENLNPNLPSSHDDFKNTTATVSLTDDLRKMLFSKEQADVSFCVDGEIISAHKNILASRSPVFSAMFKQQMAKSETGVIDISDMDAETLKLFLKFVYVGGLEELDWERMLELLLVAEKYQVPSLKNKCSQFLKLRLSPDNVCDVVSVADMVGEHALKVAAKNYIKENVAAVLSSSKWSAFTDKNVKLCSEIFCHITEDLKAKHTKT